MKLTSDQQNALDIFYDFITNSDEKYMIVQGDSGTGKSYLINEMLKLMQQNDKMRKLLLNESAQWEPVITATTNKAAFVLEEIIGNDVTTIHKFLNLIMKFNFKTGEDELLPSRNAGTIYNMLIIIDEASFISNQLFEYLNTFTHDCKIILIGDQHQLAPVKQKVPIMSIIDSNHKAELTEIVRHTGNISDLGKQFKRAVTDNIFEPIQTNSTDILAVDGFTFQSMVETSFGDKDYTPECARLLAWTNNKVLAYGVHVRKLRGYSAEFNKEEFAISNKAHFYKKNGAKISTDSEVFITDIGPDIVKENIVGKDIFLSTNSQQSLFLPNDQHEVRAYLKRLAKVKDWDTFYEIKQNWLDLRSVYASTVHKSQGSEYEKVFIDLNDIGRCTISSDAARLLYVGITRATKQVILYGSLPARYGGTPQR